MDEEYKKNNTIEVVDKYINIFEPQTINGRTKTKSLNKQKSNISLGIFPALTYASDTWVLTKTNIDNKKMVNVENTIISKRSNKWYRSKTRVEDIAELITQLK